MWEPTFLSSLSIGVEKEVDVLPSVVLGSTVSSSFTVCVSVSSEVARAESVRGNGEWDLIVEMGKWNLTRLVLVFLVRSGEAKG